MTLPAKTIPWCLGTEPGPWFITKMCALINCDGGYIICDSWYPFVSMLSNDESCLNIVTERSIDATKINSWCNQQDDANDNIIEWSFLNHFQTLKKVLYNECTNFIMDYCWLLPVAGYSLLIPLNLLDHS